MNKLLEKTKNLYRTIRFFMALLANYCYDFQRFFRFSATINAFNNQATVQGRIIAHYHVIEKGLSFKQPKPGFGSQIIENLVSLLEKYYVQYQPDEVSQVALNVLCSYYYFNLETFGIDNQYLLEKITFLKEKSSYDDFICTQGGVIPVNKNDVYKYTNIDFKNFVKSRHSIRNFSDENVDIELIETAVSIAIKTPSVCNRQTWKVHIFSEDKLKSKILSIQNGNRGFGDSANKVLIITSDINYFIGEAERNQSFIDGGLFCMSLIYALHSLGLGTCCLNWSVTFDKDISLKKEAKIKDSETIIMLIAVGHFPDNLLVPNSARRKLSDFVILH